MDIYGESGYIDINRLKKSPFIFIIGSRRTGKTYGVSKYLLDNKRFFMYVRRTTGELELSMSERQFSFKNMVHEGYNLHPEKNGKYTYEIKDEENTLGIATSLTLVSKMRGYDASEVTDIMFDEFIPEKHVNKINHEGDAVLNMYETINSNRELEGQEPVRLWMLSNSNNLNSDILTAFGIRPKIEQMMKREQEYSEYRNMTLVLAMNSPISERKRNTALYQAINDNQFKAMALENSFSYNDFSNIGKRNVIEYIPRCRIGKYVIMDHKANGTTYIMENEKMPVTKCYDFTDYSMKAFRLANFDLIDSYTWGQLCFDSFDTKSAIQLALPYIQ